MEELKVGEVIRLLQDLLNAAARGTNDKAPLQTHIRSAAVETVEGLLPHCEKLGLLVPTEYLRDILLFLRAGPAEYETASLSRSASMIAHSIEIEFRGRRFFVIRPELAKVFDEPQTFGPENSGHFGEAAYELTEAAKCLALDRSTASAFHSIRCLEAGIRALSRCLGIPDQTQGGARNWGSMLNAIKKKIDERWVGSSSRMTGDGEFFENAHAALAAMQNPWRNATMHLDQKYTEEEARHIFEIVKGFMVKLASRCDENGDPKA